jgi:PIN domain nuclease of toxin-antitoxin system
MTHETRDHSFAKCRKHPSTECISLFEIAIKTARDKLRPAEVEARRAVEDLNPLTAYTAHRTGLAGVGGDRKERTHDRQIIAQAVCEKIRVVT